MSDPRFEPEYRRRLEDEDYHAVFSAGCCYHFALKLNELFGHRLAYFRSRSSDDPNGVGHCWARHDSGRAIDINGVIAEDLLIRLNNGGEKAEAVEISRQDLEKQLATRGIPDRLNTEIMGVAERIIKTHQRFVMAQTREQKCRELFSDEDKENPSPQE
jgi:hypothetical protein